MPPLVGVLSALTFWGVAGLAALVAIVVLLGNPRRNWNRWMAIVLTLVAVDQALLAWAATSAIRQGGAGGGWEVARTQADFAGGFAYLVLIMQPTALAYFVSIFPRRAGPAAHGLERAVLGGLALFFLVLQVQHRRLSDPAFTLDPFRLAFFLYAGACYLYAAIRILRALREERSTAMARQVRTVAGGIVVVALGRLALLPWEWSRAWEVPTSGILVVLDLFARFVLFWSLVAVLAGWALNRPTPQARRRDLRELWRHVALVGAVLSVVWWLGRTTYFVGTSLGIPPSELTPDLYDLGLYVDQALTYTLVWVVFVATIVYGIVRYEALAARARTLGAIGVVAAALGGFAAVAATASLGRPWMAAAAAALVVLVTAAAALSYARGAPAGPQRLEYLRHRALEVYRANLAGALADGPPTAATEARWEDLRHRLGITDEEHQTLLAVAQAEEAAGIERELIMGRYEPVRRLGSGGYATVDLAMDHQERHLVVLKRIRQEWVGSEAALDSALRELEVARRASHPSLISIHDVARTDEGALVVMEFAEGGSLRDLLEREGHVTPQRVRLIALGALEGLGALHEAGLVHGDLKPENVLLTSQGAPKLADFGSTRPVTQRTPVQAAAPGLALATPLYMAPEQARGGRPTPLADLYAVGAIVFELLTGSPYVEARGRSLYEVVRDIAQGLPPERLAPLGPQWQGVLAKALAPNPAERFESARQMAEAIRKAVAGPRRVRARDALPW